MSGGWYPLDAGSTRRQIGRFLEGAPGAGDGAALAPGNAGCAGVVPHAGWDFSGAIAAEVFSRLRHDLATLVVVGGHLPAGSGLLAAGEGAYETPLGEVEADLELLAFLRARLQGRAVLREDRRPDNTVEVQLPFVRYFFPGARALWLRAEPGPAAIELGEALAAAAARPGPLGVVGSTDLTHYGPAYGFTPHGAGPQAVEWVRQVNDRRVIETLLELRPAEALRRGVEEESACSIGGAAAAAAYARATGSTRGLLLRYRTSGEIHSSESFVGYAGILYPAP